MRLVSCNNCGVVLDEDKLNFPDESSIFVNDMIDDSLASWIGD